MGISKYPNITCKLGRKVNVTVNDLEYLQNLGILNRNTLVLKMKFRNLSENIIYLPVEIDKNSKFITNLRIGSHRFEIAISKNYELDAKHWSEE